MKKKTRRQKNSDDSDVNALEVERIVNEQAEMHPRLKISRTASRDLTATNDGFVEETLKTFRQRLKDK